MNQECEPQALDLDESQRLGDGLGNQSWTAQERLEWVEQCHNQGEYLIDKLMNHLRPTLRCSRMAFTSQKKLSLSLKKEFLEFFFKFIKCV